jgi:hypothetical protein
VGARRPAAAPSSLQAARSGGAASHDECQRPVGCATAHRAAIGPTRGRAHAAGGLWGATPPAPSEARETAPCTEGASVAQGRAAARRWSRSDPPSQGAVSRACAGPPEGRRPAGVCEAYVRQPSCVTNGVQPFEANACPARGRAQQGDCRSRQIGRSSVAAKRTARTRRKGFCSVGALR